MAAPATLLVIGVDAGDKDLILRWSSAGVLPTFRALLQRGTWGLTANPEGVYVGAVWPSFWTGRSPARHGRYCYRQIPSGSYDERRVTPRDTKGEPFWDPLSRAGRRVAIIDVPKTAPSERIDGIQVVDWGTHDPELGFCTSPAALAREIAARFGEHPVRRCDARRGQAAQFSELRDALVRGVERKADLAAYFLAKGGWDLFLTVFAESHCVGHQCWHLHDATHPRHDADLAGAVGDPVRDVYVAIDAAIGGLLARAGEDCTVLVLASHGMGPHYDGTFLLDEILRRREAAEARRTTAAVGRMLASCWRHAPQPLRARLRPLRVRAKEAFGEALAAPGIANRRCFTIPNNDVYGGIRINVVGREPHGRVRAGAEYEAFCDGLTRDLLALVNLDTGRPLVRRVLRTADLYDGECLDDFPDLMVEWDRDAPIAAVSSPKTGTIRRVFAGNRTGDHTREGLFVAAGPSIPRARLRRPVAVTSFAPTIAALLGVSLPEADGEPIAELLRLDAAANDA